MWDDVQDCYNENIIINEQKQRYMNTKSIVFSACWDSIDYNMDIIAIISSLEGTKRLNIWNILVETNEDTAKDENRRIEKRNRKRINRTRQQSQILISDTVFYNCCSNHQIWSQKKQTIDIQKKNI